MVPMGGNGNGNRNKNWVVGPRDKIVLVPGCKWSKLMIHTVYKVVRVRGRMGPNRRDGDGVRSAVNLVESASSRVMKMFDVAQRT